MEKDLSLKQVLEKLNQVIDNQRSLIQEQREIKRALEWDSIPDMSRLVRKLKEEKFLTTRRVELILKCCTRTAIRKMRMLAKNNPRVKFYNSDRLNNPARVVLTK